MRGLLNRPFYFRFRLLEEQMMKLVRRDRANLRKVRYRFYVFFFQIT